MSTVKQRKKLAERIVSAQKSKPRPLVKVSPIVAAQQTEKEPEPPVKPNSAYPTRYSKEPIRPEFIYEPSMPRSTGFGMKPRTKKHNF